nr:MAG TPA: hypothetical protein [Caudoviricetes sp.]
MCCVVLFHCQINCVMQLFCLSDAVSCNLVNYFDFSRMLRFLLRSSCGF